jgi:hypothetical protein
VKRDRKGGRGRGVQVVERYLSILSKHLSNPIVHASIYDNQHPSPRSIKACHFYDVVVGEGIDSSYDVREIMENPPGNRR